MLLAGCAPLSPLENADFTFGVLGDTPYSERQVRELDGLIERMNKQDLAFVVHVGDIGTSAVSQACSDAWLEARQAQFARLRHPFVLLPGDNEWTDCARHGLDPQARLAAWRKLFCRKVAGVERQPAHCENVRWHADGMVFIGLNVPGGGNPDLADARMAATLEWLDESLSRAEARGAERIFILMHADPRFGRTGARDAYGRLRAVLATHAAWFAGRLVLVHGDTHLSRDDEPVPGMRRLGIWGAPFVAWLRVSQSGQRLRAESGW